MRVGSERSSGLRVHKCRKQASDAALRFPTPKDPSAVSEPVIQLRRCATQIMSITNKDAMSFPGGIVGILRGKLPKSGSREAAEAALEERHGTNGCNDAE